MAQEGPRGHAKLPSRAPLGGKHGACEQHRNFGKMDLVLDSVAHFRVMLGIGRQREIPLRSPVGREVQFCMVP